jgi:hypothetical protein
VRELDVAGLTPTLPPAQCVKKKNFMLGSNGSSLMAEAGTVDTPVLARTAKLAAVPSSTGAGPAAVAQRKAAYHDFDSMLA